MDMSIYQAQKWQDIRDQRHADEAKAEMAFNAVYQPIFDRLDNGRLDAIKASFDVRKQENREQWGAYYASVKTDCNYSGCGKCDACTVERPEYVGSFEDSNEYKEYSSLLAEISEQALAEANEAIAATNAANAEAERVNTVVSVLSGNLRGVTTSFSTNEIGFFSNGGWIDCLVSELTDSHKESLLNAITKECRDWADEFLATKAVAAETDSFVFVEEDDSTTLNADELKAARKAAKQAEKAAKIAAKKCRI